MFSVEQSVLEGCGFRQVRMEGSGHVVSILPDAGFNLWYWTYEGKEILMEPVDIRVIGTKYGIPILFPTPNRVENGEYTWQGRTYTMTKRGEKVVIHGLVKDEPFTVTRLEAGEDTAVCEAAIRIEEGNALYEGYPFACELVVRYTLTAAGLHMDVWVRNQDEKEMPFGFAVHPYFSKRGDAGRVALTVPCCRVYEASEKKIPTGRILPVAEDQVIADGYHTVESLYLDTVYRGLTADQESKIQYEDIVIHITASDCFRNAVVYTPHDRPGFCIEPQTCATNFINMHARGLLDESGLLVLPAGQEFTCEVDYRIDKR